MNPIEYLQSKNFRITSDPNEYRQSYPDGKRNPWGLRNYHENGKNMDAYCNGYHRAYDMSDKDGAAIPSIADGGVVADGTRDNGTFGGQVLVVYEDLGMQVLYGHVKRPVPVKIGDVVNQGDTVAYQGSTNNQGVSMSSHLHIQFQNIEALDEQAFTCSGIDPLKIDVDKAKPIKKGSGKMVKVKQQLSHNKNHAGSGNPMNFITVHMTANTSKGANAQAHANLIDNGFAATWHYTVDDTQAIQHFYESTRCFHAGDGTGKGNYESIGIELAVNSDGDYNKTLENGASLIADIMKRRNISLNNVVTHGYWTGKHCPRELLNGKNGINWNDFKRMIQSGGGVAPSKPAKKAPAKPKPSSSKTPRTIGNWQTNKHGTQFIKAEGTFTVGGTRIMSREGSPFLSAPEGGWAYPDWPIKYDELVRQDGHVWIGYTQNGKRWYLPYNTWNSRTGAVSKNPWGAFS